MEIAEEPSEDRAREKERPPAVKVPRGKGGLWTLICHARGLEPKKMYIGTRDRQRSVGTRIQMSEESAITTEPGQVMIIQN